MNQGVRDEQSSRFRVLLREREFPGIVGNQQVNWEYMSKYDHTKMV